MSVSARARARGHEWSERVRMPNISSTIEIARKEIA